MVDASSRRANRATDVLHAATAGSWRLTVAAMLLTIASPIAFSAREHMLAKSKTCAVVGLDGFVVEVEVDISPGLPAFKMVATQPPSPPRPKATA